MEMEGICDDHKKYRDDDNDDDEEEEEEETIDLPGFRFNPTDEELVGFYLLRKVEGKSISIELIKQVDIYKYDPWDLPTMGSSSNSGVGDKEWYYFCMRGRKYRNSSRPNRVTVKGSGFWKATGIDKPIYSSNYMKCIGLKKSLVYYCGSAGKGTKTDWMMHEFRLPPNYSNISNNTNTIHQQSASAEVWTLCRIFKRNASSYKKFTPNYKQSINSKTGLKESNSRTCSLESAESRAKYITVFKDKDLENNLQERSHYEMAQEISVTQSLFTLSSSNLWNPNGDDTFIRNGNWDELGSVVELALDRPV